MSGNEQEAVQERFQSNTRALGQLWARLAGDANVWIQADALYMHGLSRGMVASCDLFGVAVELISLGYASNLAFNGSDGRGATPDIGPGKSWPGADWFREEFKQRKVIEERLCPTDAGLHSWSETDEFVKLAKGKGWTTAYVVTVPYHWPRSLSCLVGSMAKHNHQMKIWFATPLKVPDWNYPMEGSQGVLSDSTYGREAGDDVARLFSYWDKGREDNGETLWRSARGGPQLPQLARQHLGATLLHL